MSTAKIERPRDDDYFVAPWSAGFLQGDIFKDVPLALPTPPDAVFMAEGKRRFISGDFDAGPTMLISPSCAMAAQGDDVSPGSYAHPARTLIPLRPVSELVDAGALEGDNVRLLQLDRLRNYLYLPSAQAFGLEESAALLYQSLTLHHDVIAEDRIAQLTGTAFWQLRVKLMAFSGSYLIHPSALGAAPKATDREM